MAAGARSYLTKPLDIADFFRVIEETMRERKASFTCAAA
jgi:DNA-binding response OmpR family regulator